MKRKENQRIIIAMKRNFQGRRPHNSPQQVYFSINQQQVVVLYKEAQVVSTRRKERVN